MVETGPILEIIATLLAPIFLRPNESKKEGITVAITAKRIPYHQLVVDCSNKVMSEVTKKM